MIAQRKWYETDPERHNIITAAIVNISRNFYDVPFPAKADRKSALSVVDFVRETAKEAGEYDFNDISEFTVSERKKFAEELRCNRSFAETDMPAGIITDKNGLFVSINDADHMEISAQVHGSDIYSAYDICSKFERLEGFQTRYAFNNEFGYLTSEATRTGTGLKVSLVINIPGIVLSGGMEDLVNVLSGMGIEVSEPFYEDEVLSPDFITITNRETLGISEQDILSLVAEAGEIVALKEAEARDSLLGSNSVKVRDVLWRSFGILKYARDVSQGEAHRLISRLCFGIDEGVINDVEGFNLMEVAVNVCFAATCVRTGKVFTKGEENQARADYLRNIFNNLESRRI